MRKLKGRRTNAAPAENVKRCVRKMCIRDRPRELCAALDTLLPEYPTCAGAVRPARAALWRYVWPPLLFTAGCFFPLALGGVWTMLAAVWFFAGGWWLSIRLAGYFRAGFGVGRGAVTMRYSRGLALYEVHVPCEVADCLVTVSYTHLDVYKRQIYSSTNTRKESADTGVNTLWRVAFIAASVAGLYRIFRVPTTASLATKPDTSATDACQKPNPSGAKTGAIVRPMEARMLCPLCSGASMFSRKSKERRNQITMEAASRMVPARTAKSLDRKSVV